METPTTNTLVSDHIIKALCNTLVHSLWQGIILALLTGAIIIFTKKVSAAARYKLLVGALGLFACGVLFTFTWQLQKTAGNSITNPGRSTSVNVIGVPPAGVLAVSPQTSQSIIVIAKPGIPRAQQAETITETVINYFNTHYSIIVLIWFLIICAKSVQMAAGLHAVFHLRRTRVFAVSKDWEDRLLQLSAQLRIKQAIALMESGIAKVPMVIGHLKPVILIPVGLINSLTADEVEAILMHELAHIRRRDYLVNLLQSFMEIIFFFNPAVLWISQLIRAERENCCDDLAIAQSRDKENYIRALVSCEEYQAGGPAYAMAFPGSKNTLLDRVKRMIGNRNHSLNTFEKTVLTICLVVLGLGISAFTARDHIKKALKSVAAVIHHGTKVDGKEQLKAAKDDTTLKNQDASINRSAALLVQLQKKALSGTDTGKSAGVSALKQITDKLDSARRNSGTAQPPLAALAKLDTTAFKKFHAIGLELYREHLVVDTNHLSISLNDQELIVNGVRMPENVFERISRQFNHSGNHNSSYANPYGNEYPGSNYANRPDVSREIAWELIKENLVTDKTYFSYRLSRDEFSIDGIKQPDDLRRRIIDQFFKPDDNFNLSYTFKDPGIYAGSNSGYNKSSADYQRQGEEQQKYWAGQQRKIIDEMAREGLINNRNNVSFTLTDKTLVIDGMVQNGEVFQKYREEYVPADAGDNWTWNYTGPGSYPTNAYRSRDWDAYSRQSAAERQRADTERDKKLVADLLQDGLITDPNNVTFTLSNKKLEINGKKQSEELYNKYKDKYLPNNNRDTTWSWTYSHH